jgi:hypothetical protein
MTLNSSIMFFGTIILENGFKCNICREYYMVYLHCILLDVIVVIGAILHVWVAHLKSIRSILKTLQHKQSTCALLVFLVPNIFQSSKPTKCLTCSSKVLLL